MDELGLADQEGSCRGRMGRGKSSYDDTVDYKSKNLHAERRRREKLSSRLLTLRALVPIITNVIALNLDFLFLIYINRTVDVISFGCS